DAVGKRGAEDGAEIAIERRPVERRAAEEGQVLLAVIADREDVVGPQPAVTRAAVVLDSSADVGMVGVAVAATLKVRGQRERGMRDTGGIRVREPFLPAVRPGEPAEEMVEGAVLHHEYDHVIDPRRGRVD